jgi:hypothetical protein
MAWLLSDNLSQSLLILLLKESDPMVRSTT